ncbi:Bifunctional epoxide hydrolase 2 [Entomortierella chlamydospora]|uniref:Bifunctional epoxide hydrolase 2 n=1 Tax=Entomortierella chlamydospora TaxID=101097 RepID=A0A9P6N1V0_9FUNG|nr:Bifunctional epoxide hydrolase 2 [Entomortierella chlamydospora]KAG0020987.1 Bifunctional epoxide hydrolase 2 [Entomortierella chlamydospora]
MAGQQQQQRPSSVTEALIGVYANLPLMEAAHAATSKPTAPEYEPSSFNHKYATVNGYKYHYVEEGNLDGIALVLIHGFPDMWYGWRYQIRHLAKQGYRVIAIDNLGTGETDHPRCDDGNYDVYRSKNLASNVVGLLDELKIEKAVLIGHDWGAFIAGKVGLHFPERCHTVISLGMPFFKPSVEYDYLEGDLKKFPQFSYVPIFQSKESDNWFDGDAQKSATALLNMLYYTSPGTNVQEKNYYIDSFSRTTLHGPLNLYRASRLNHQDEQPYVGKNYIPPVFRITIEKDPIVTPEYIAIHPIDWYDSIEFGTVSEGGHFATTENPDEVNRVLTEYLAKFFKK